MKSTSNQNSKTLNGEAQFAYAENYARRSNWLFRLFQDKHRAYLALKSKLSSWKQYFDNTLLFIMSLAWLTFCVAEGDVSYELYREMSDTLPPFICILGLIFIGILNSHWLRLIAPEIYRFESHYSAEISGGKLAMEIEEEMQRKKRKQITIGILMLLAIIALLTQLSIMRVQLELDANMRYNRGFNAFDTLPMVFYAMEVFTGIYFISMLKAAQLVWQHRHLKQQRDLLLQRSVKLNERCGAYYREARKAGFNQMESEELYIALQRYFHESVNDPTILVFTEVSHGTPGLNEKPTFPELDEPES